MRLNKSITALLVAVFVIPMLTGCARTVVHVKRPAPSKKVVVINR